MMCWKDSKTDEHSTTTTKTTRDSSDKRSTNNEIRPTNRHFSSTSTLKPFLKRKAEKIRFAMKTNKKRRNKENKEERERESPLIVCVHILLELVLKRRERWERRERERKEEQTFSMFCAE